MHKEKEERILQMVRERMPDTEIRPVEICKNNGCLRKGIRLFRKGNPKGVVVYWDGAEAACGASCTEEEAADYIRRAAEKELPVMICGEDLQNWEKAKHMVSRKLVNHERNREQLQTLVHRRYLDLAEVYYLKIPIGEEGWGNGNIPVQFLEEWGIGAEELAEQAEANMETEGYGIQSMKEFLAETFSREEALLPEPPDTGLYLIQNRRREFGAGVLSSRRLMKRFMEEVGESCYILPSSTHELLAVPLSMQPEPEALRAMVREVNQTAVGPEEFLSDSVYYCHKDTGEVELCGGCRAEAAAGLPDRLSGS